MLTPALRRHRRNRALHDLQQRLLYAFAGHVARDGRIVRLAGNLVHLVDIDDSTLGPFDIVVGGLQQAQNDVLHILADITGFGERCRIRHGERHIQNTSQRLGQQRLAASRRADQQNIGLRDLDIARLGVAAEALVMIVYGHGKHALGPVLTDYVVVENLADTGRRRNAVPGFHERASILLPNDIHAQFDALVANEDGRSCYQLPDLVLTFSTERTVERVLGIAARFAHLRSQHSPKPQPASRKAMLAMFAARANGFRRKMLRPACRRSRPFPLRSECGVRPPRPRYRIPGLHRGS